MKYLVDVLYETKTGKQRTKMGVPVSATSENGLEAITKAIKIVSAANPAFKTVLSASISKDTKP